MLKDIQAHCNFKEEPIIINKLHGGNTNAVFQIYADNKYWVLKQNNASAFPKMMAYELEALNFFRANGILNYPKPLNSSISGELQYIVMEYIEPQQKSIQGQIKLGQILAKQHKISSDSFGWETDNYIGHLPQINTKMTDWNHFFAENRLIILGKMGFNKKLLEKKDLQQIERLCYLLKDIFTVEKPSLLHGDLWSGNYFISNNNNPILFDPAIYFGHRECDLAMTKLFGGFSEEFYTAYQEDFPLVEGWENRIPFFQLYPLLVHLNIFGKAYLTQIRAIIKSF